MATQISCWLYSVMANDNSIFSIDIKLDGSNYREWAFSVRTVVRAAGFDEHLTDGPPDEKEDEATRKAWKNTDAKVMGALILNVAPSLRTSLEHYSTAKEIWKYFGAKISSAQWRTSVFLIAKSSESSTTGHVHRGLLWSFYSDLKPVALNDSKESLWM